MRLPDYLRLGFAGVKAHKKRAFTVVMIVGLLFSVIAAGTFILQGLENIALGTMLAPTDGKVLVLSSVDTTICEEDCDLKAETKKIKQNIEHYGGKVIPATISQTADGMFYNIGEDVFTSEAINNTDLAQVIVPLEVAAKLIDIKMPGYDASLTDKLNFIRKVREKALHQVVETKSGETYYIAEILPGGVYANDLSFANIGQDDNPLNLILGQIRTGTSQNFIIRSAETEPEINIDIEEMGMVFAEFEDIKAAHNYYQDKVNYCSEIDRIFSMCGKDYKYQVLSAVSNPIMTYDNLQNVWLVFKIVAAVLAVIAIVIMISTYGRLIGKDVKIIALYHAIGASKAQIKLVYLTYLLTLSLMTVGFAIVVGLALAAILSLVNMTALTQVFTLSFGVETSEIWLVGWNNLTLWIVGAMILAAVIAVLLGNGNFSTKELARRLK